MKPKDQKGRPGSGREPRNLPPLLTPEDQEQAYGPALAPDPTPAGGRPVTADDHPLDVVLDRLVGVRASGDGYVACCPAHADFTPSLSVHETAEGHVLLCCHAGCQNEDVVAAMGLTMANLYLSEFTRRFGRRRADPPLGTSRPARGAGDGGLDAPDQPYSDIYRAAYRNRGNAVAALASALGLPDRALDDFGVGFDGRAYTFPEWDHRHRIVGVMYRTLGGDKYGAKGGARGLAVPTDNTWLPGPMHVAEGASDAVALHSVGARVVGRPMAKVTGLTRRWLDAYLYPKTSAGVVVVGDNDRPDGAGRRLGSAEAKALAESLAETLPGNFPVAWAVPQMRFKDVREQVAKGCWPLGLRVTRVRGGKGVIA